MGKAIVITAAAVAAFWSTLAAGQAASTGSGQAYPTRPIRLIIGVPPGGAADFTARIVGQKLSDGLGQNVVAENRGGAGGTIASDITAKANPDGYTLLWSSSTTHGVGPVLYTHLPYDADRDFTHIALATSLPMYMVVHQSVPAKSVKELIALAKAKPGVLTYASGGNGSSTHLAAEEFKQLAGIQMIHVPYKGGGPALIDVIGGRVTMYFSSLPPSLPHIKAGRLRALGITSKERSPLLPDVPTISEAALPGFESGSSYGIVVPAHTPQAIVLKMNAEIARLVATPEVSARLKEQGLHNGAGAPQDFGRFMKAEIAQWARVIKASGANVN